jgi:hypothetical protein
MSVSAIVLADPVPMRRLALAQSGSLLTPIRSDMLRDQSSPRLHLSGILPHAAQRRM